MMTDRKKGQSKSKCPWNGGTTNRDNWWRLLW